MLQDYLIPVSSVPIASVTPIAISGYESKELECTDIRKMCESTGLTVAVSSCRDDDVVI